MPDVIEVGSIEELVQLITEMPDGVIVEVEFGEEDADDWREGI